MKNKFFLILLYAGLYVLVITAIKMFYYLLFGNVIEDYIAYMITVIFLVIIFLFKNKKWLLLLIISNDIWI
jgi:hypothetical protein